MPSLYIVANQVVGSSGHLQMVRANGTTWGSSTSWIETEVQSPAITTLGNWDYKIFGQSYGTGGAKAYYSGITLEATQTVDYVWQLAGQIHASMKINGADLDYNVANQNSNSFIRTLLYVIGNDENWGAKYSSVGLTSFPGWGKNVLFGAELGWTTTSGIALNLAGTSGNDVIRTGNGNDTLGGSAGNDRISSNSGRDTIRGGTGNDTLYGQNDNDFLYGDGGNDRLYGGNGSDTIYGGTGSDVILGDVGLDKLYGGVDGVWDTFVFTSGSTSKSSPDTVFDFVAGVDFIDLRQYDSNSTVSGDQAFVFGGQTAATRGIWCVDVGTDIIIYGDITGDAVSDFAIRVAGVNPLSIANFFL